MRIHGFRICNGKGFHITFENGYSLSVQFGPDNYADNYEMVREGSYDEMNVLAGKRGSSCAEIALINLAGDLEDFPDGDDVKGRQSPAEVLRWLQYQAAR